MSSSRPRPNSTSQASRSSSERSRAQRQVLREWRRGNFEEEERLMAFKVKGVSDMVSNAVASLRLDQRRGESQIQSAWTHLIDPTVTAHARPVGLRRGTLFVNVDNSVWLSEIVRYRKNEILERLQQCFGRDLIQRISFRIG